MLCSIFSFFNDMQWPYIFRLIHGNYTSWQHGNSHRHAVFIRCANTKDNIIVALIYTNFLCCHKVDVDVLELLVFAISNWLAEYIFHYLFKRGKGDGCRLTNISLHHISYGRCYLRDHLSHHVILTWRNSPLTNKLVALILVTWFTCNLQFPLLLGRILWSEDFMFPARSSGTVEYRCHFRSGGQGGW